MRVRRSPGPCSRHHWGRSSKDSPGWCRCKPVFCLVCACAMHRDSFSLSRKGQICRLQNVSFQICLQTAQESSYPASAAIVQPCACCQPSPCCTSHSCLCQEPWTLRQVGGDNCAGSTCSSARGSCGCGFSFTPGARGPLGGRLPNDKKGGQAERGNIRQLQITDLQRLQHHHKQVRVKLITKSDVLANAVFVVFRGYQSSLLARCLFLAT